MMCSSNADWSLLREHSSCSGSIIRARHISHSHWVRFILSILYIGADHGLLFFSGHLIR